MGGIWWRSGRKSAALFLYGRRRYHVPTPINLLYRSRLIKQDTHIILPLLHPHWDAQSFFARSYACLAKVKAKEGGNKIQAVTEHDGPRLNAEITAYEVRLVSENGHEVISRREALARAKKLKLDLVEVQRNANPPVCKIMDHNKEKYKQQQREKERTKNKPELILRKADCREIRYTSKTEQKDLERKAEMVKRLLERGYRVKCTAMGTAQENLEEQLLRLSTLIEDFSIVESGPRVEKKGAWLIVKHVKFGHAKRKEVQQTPKSEEIIKQGHSSLPVSANLNIGPEKQVQIGQYDCKQFVPVDGLKQVIFGKIQSDQRLHVSNVGKLGSVDSVSECATASIMENVKDIPDDHQFQVSTTSEVTNNIVEELQTPPIKLIYAASTQDQQKIAIGTPKIPAASLSQALVNRSSGSHAKTGKRPLADILPKEANESRWAVLKQVKPSCFDGNNNSTPANEVMRNIVEELQSSPANLNNGAGAQDSQKMSIGSAQISADGSRQVLVKHSSGDKEKGVSETVKKPLKDVLSEQENESRWASLGHHKPSCFGDNNNTTATSEITSFVFEELQNSPVKLNNDAPTKDQQHMAIGSPQIASHGLEQVLVNCSSSNQEISVSEAGKQPLADMIPKQPNESQWETFREIKTSNVKGNNNTATQKQDQIGQYDCKQIVPVDGLKQVISGKIQSDQRQHASNVGKLESVDSVSERASGSIIANVKDIPDDHQFQVSTTSEVTNNIVEELQTPPIKLIYAASTQDQQKMAIGTPKISAASLRQALVNRSSGSHEKTGKRPLADILPKEANESRWAILKQVKPSRFDGNNNSTPANEVMRNIVEELQSSPVNLNNGAGAQDSQKMSIGSAQISADGSRQVLVKRSSGNKEKGGSETVKKPFKVVLSEQANESRWASLGHLKPSRFGDNNNTTATSEITSFVFEELQNSPVKLNNDAATKGQQHMAIGSPQIASHGLEQVLVNCRSSNREICASEAGKQPLADMVPKQPNESQWETFREIMISNVKGNNNTATQVQLGVSNGKHDVVSDDTRQDPPCPRPSHQGHHVSNIEKQIPITLASIPDKVLGEIHGIFPQGPSTVDVNEYGLTKTKIGVKNAKQTTPSEHKRQDISAVRSGPSGYSATKEVKHKPLDCSPKQANNTRLSTSGISEELPMSSVQVTKIAMPRKSLEISNSNTIPWYDARKDPAVDSPSGQGSCVSVTGKQSPIDSYSRQSSASGGSHWGIFSQPKNSVVENQRHPTKMPHDQSKKEQPNILWGSNIGASDEAQNDADPRHLHIQNQRKVPISSTVTSKQDPKHTENEAVNEPRQKGWGIFSKKVLAKPLDTKGKPEV